MCKQSRFAHNSIRNLGSTLPDTDTAVLPSGLKNTWQAIYECDTRQRSIDELYISNDFFTEYFLLDFVECHLDLSKESRHYDAK
jgi:hypothetical protein